jgi:hypothetical protein
MKGKGLLFFVVCARSYEPEDGSKHLLVCYCASSLYVVTSYEEELKVAEMHGTGMYACVSITVGLVSWCTCTSGKNEMSFC